MKKYSTDNFKDQRFNFQGGKDVWSKAVRDPGTLAHRYLTHYRVGKNRWRIAVPCSHNRYGVAWLALGTASFTINYLSII